MNRSERGQDAERAARQFLERKGLRLIERNYRTRLGEIDLVMRHGGELVFVEVRYRRSRSFGGALESIDKAKRRRLTAAALQYLQQHPTGSGARFDVVALHADGQLQWIKNAFDVG